MQKGDNSKGPTVMRSVVNRLQTGNLGIPIGYGAVTNRAQRQQEGLRSLRQPYQIQWYHALCVVCWFWVFLLFSAALLASVVEVSCTFPALTGCGPGWTSLRATRCV
jgi:hypothetical protein